MGLTSSIASIARSTWGSMFGTTRDQAQLDAWHVGMAGPPSDRINQNPYPPPFQNPQDLDVYSREASEMRFAYQRFYASEPTFQSAIDGKVASIAGLDVGIQPCDESSAIDKKAAEFCRDAIANCPGGFSGLIENILRPAFLTGFSITEKWLGGVDEEACFNRLRPKWNGLWAPRRMASIDTNYMRFQLDEARQITGVINTRLGLKGYSPDRVLIFTHRKLFENPYGRSDGRSAYRACQMIENAYKLWYTAIKNYAAPFLTVKTDSKGAILTALQRALNEARAGGWLTVSKQDEIELLNFASASSFQAFERKVMIARQEIYLAVRGSWLPFLEGSQQDGRGDSQVHKVASDAIESLLVQSACEVVNQQLIPDLVRPNFGDQCGLPTMTLGGTNWMETKTQLEVIRTVEKDLGRPVSTKLIYKISQQEPPRDDGDGPPKPPEPAPQPSPQGGLGSMPFDELHQKLNDWNQHGRESFAGPPGPPPHPGLVWKESTHRWVLPDQPSGGGYKPQTNPSEDAYQKAHSIIQESHDNPSMKLVHEAFVGAATGQLDAFKIANAAAAMKSLNMHQLRAMKTFYGIGGTTSNKDPMIANILAAVKGMPSNAKPEPKESPAPVSPSAPAPATTAPSKTAASPATLMPAKMPQVQQTKILGGSTGAVQVKDQDGNLYVKKDGSKGKGGKAQLESESNCDRLYRFVGVTVPESKYYGEAEEKLARWVDGKTLAEFEAHASPDQIKAAHAEIQKGFAADALFANYDVIGLAKDNIIIDKSGKAYRIDNGGSLTFRAQGGTKPFGETVSELESLRNASINPNAASVFGSLTDAEIVKQIHTLVEKKDKIVFATPAALKDTMAARLDYMAEWAENIEGKAKKPSSGEKVAPNAKPHSDKGQAVQNFKAPKGFSKTAAPNSKLPDAARPTLTLTEANSLQAYTGSVYKVINNGLRNPPPTGKAAEHAKNIQAAFDRAAVFDKPVTVYRGISGNDGSEDFFGRVADAITKNQGVLELHGFVSTTTTPSNAFDGPVSIEIEAIHGIDAKPYSSVSHENELLLPHQSRYKVVSYTHEGPKGVPYVKLKQLPPLTAKK